MEAVMDSCWCFSSEPLEEWANSVDHKGLVYEEESEFHRMHGWV